MTAPELLERMKTAELRWVPKSVQGEGQQLETRDLWLGISKCNDEIESLALDLFQAGKTVVSENDIGVLKYWLVGDPKMPSDVMNWDEYMEKEL